MSWEKCVTVTLNSDSTGCFYTGDIVTGTVTLDLDKDLKIGMIDLEIIGTSKAQWNRAMPTMPYIKNYSEKKRVLYVKTDDIFRCFRRNNTIPAGVYSYPFHFALPEDLPSTFKSSLAKVYYSIKIKSKPKYVYSKKVVPFNVLGTVNLNDQDEMLKPCIYEFKRIFKRIAAKVAVEVRTYKGIAPKQTVPFEVTVYNEKKIRISEVNICLVQLLQYTVSSGYLNEEKKISKVANKDVRKSMSGAYNLKMEIPHITPSSLHTAETMIDISYVFRVGVCFPFHFNLYEDIPVTVATVPLIYHDLHCDQI